MKKFLSFIFLTIFSVISLAAETVKIQILQSSDLHGMFLPFEYASASAYTNGSAAQVATVIKKLKAENPNTLLIDTGDTIQDNSHELFLKNSEVTPMITYLNELKYNAFVPGNHEFNFGMDVLNKQIKDFKGDFIVANLFDKSGKRPYAPYKIYTVGGAKIAFIGVTSPHSKTKWDSENLKDYSMTNPVEEVKKLIPELKGKADVIVVGAHMGLDGEYGDGDSAKEIAEKNPEVAAVFLAHEHATKNEKASTGAALVEPSSRGALVGRVEITLTKENGKLVLKDRNTDVKSENVTTKGVEADKEITDKLTRQHEMAVKEAATVIGKLTGGSLVGKDEIKGIPQAQIAPSAMIDFINEVQAYYTKADISSAASFRNDANMHEGEIKKSDVALIYKYDNTLRAYELTGAELKKYMEWSAQYFNTLGKDDLTISFDENVRGYNFDMFSGVKYDINISKPAGQRIENLTKLDGTPIKDTDKFVVAVNDYRGKSTLGAEKGLFPGKKPVVDLYDTLGDGARIRDLIAKYIKEVKGGTISPKVNNNWKITGIQWDPKLHAEAAALINEGKLTLPKSADGRTSNVKAITVEDLKKAQGK